MRSPLIKAASIPSERAEAIDEVASSFGSSVALVPINALFTQASQAGYTVGGFPAPLSPQFGGGLVSWDGLHPSNLGYAIIANQFISTADTAFGMTIPQLSPLQLAGIASTDPYDPYVVKAGDPDSPFPLP
ncbi:MAG TPA: hypothetical protein VMF11_02455 [Candidatus Baltobacteraceae bacterium]|nr:hypothetical protein [Candidatus Baltobacteraceae bacterium]